MVRHKESLCYGWRWQVQPTADSRYIPHVFPCLSFHTTCEKSIILCYPTVKADGNHYLDSYWPGMEWHQAFDRNNRSWEVHVPVRQSRKEGRSEQMDWTPSDNGSVDCMIEWGGPWKVPHPVFSEDNKTCPRNWNFLNTIRQSLVVTHWHRLVACTLQDNRSFPLQ